MFTNQIVPFNKLIVSNHTVEKGLTLETASDILQKTI